MYDYNYSQIPQYYNDFYNNQSIKYSNTRTKKIKAEVFAFNLRTPTHMEWTKDGRLLVSEHTAGEVKDITRGGDFKNVKPFAYGLKGPSSILPLQDGRLLVAEAWGDGVSDITNGGDISQKTPLAKLKEPYSLSTINGRIFVTEERELATLTLSEIIFQNGSVGQTVPIVTRIPAMPLPGLEGLSPYKNMQKILEGPKCGSWTVALPLESRLLVTCSALGQIIQVTTNGDYIDLVGKGNLIASGLNFSGGMINNDKDGLIYITQPLKGTVMAIDPNNYRDYRFDPPVVQGLNMPTCVRFSPDGQSMFICSMTTGSVWRITNF